MVKIRPELNLEKWPVWVPSNARGETQIKTIEREGAKLEVTPNVKWGHLTTDDQKVYYALVKIWEDAGRPDTFVSFSLRQVSDTVGRGWGTANIESLKAALMRLRATLFVWENSYFDSATGDTVELLDTFNILSELKISRRKSDGATNRGIGYFRFHDYIVANLIRNYTKPLLFNVVLRFRSEIAQLLYTRLDFFLADRPKYERYTAALFEDLGLHGTAYKYPSKRVQTLTSALKELEGAPLSKGGIIETATIEEGARGTDYKAVFKKGRARHAPAASSLPAETKRIEKGEVPVSGDETHAAELVRFFNLTFFGREDASAINRRSLDQAVTLVSGRGVERARAVVTYAYREAPKTKFAIKTFGGIIQYENPAIAEHDQKADEQRRKEERAKAERAAQDAQDAHRAAQATQLDAEMVEAERNAPAAFQGFIRYVEKRRNEVSKKFAQIPTIQKRMLDDFTHPERRRELWQEWKQLQTTEQKKPIPQPEKKQLTSEEDPETIARLIGESLGMET